MIGSMYSGISGLKSNTSNMEVIGDNIANVDTNGFKASRVSFANIFSASLSTHSPQTGRGASLQSVEVQWDSGSLENTSSATDFAINGTGLFVVDDPSKEMTYYTRAGSFEWDKDGNLVNSDGFVVQGYAIDPDGTVGRVEDIALPLEINEPEATDEITFGLNLNSDAEVGDTFTSSITAYNSLGSEVVLDVVFERTATGWTWDVDTDPTTATCTTNGVINFDANGDLDPAAAVYGEGTPPITTGNPVINVSNLDGADPLAVTWTYLDVAGDSDGTVTGYSSESAKTSQSQNGLPSGTLQTVAVDEEGVFSGIYSNGSIVPFTQLALADFPSYSGLYKMGSNLYSETMNSGQALIGVANTAGLGSIAPSSLELSNVDLATEFVEMITTQRAYQANSKVITTSDELLNELINIKR